MPSVEVYNGDLEDALQVFKRKMENEGTMGEYKKRLAFTSPAAERRQKEYHAETKHKSRAKRRALRQEAAKHRKDR